MRLTMYVEILRKAYKHSILLLGHVFLKPTEQIFAHLLRILDMLPRTRIQMNSSALSMNLRNPFMLIEN